MKFLERFTLITYSLIMLILSVILSLLIFNWIDFGTVTDMVEALITGSLSSKITLGVCVVFILLKNENGQLMISKETIDNMVKHAVTGFENVKECNTKIDVNEENQLKITLFLTVNENVVIKELASNLQTKIKDEVKKVSDLDVQEVNVKVMSIQENKKGKEKE